MDNICRRTSCKETIDRHWVPGGLCYECTAALWLDYDNHRMIFDRRYRIFRYPNDDENLSFSSEEEEKSHGELLKCPFIFCRHEQAEFLFVDGLCSRCADIFDPVSDVNRNSTIKKLKTFLRSITLVFFDMQKRK